MIVKGETRTLALVSKYSSPDPELLEESFGTLWAFKKQMPGEEVLTVIDVKDISSIVCIAPLLRDVLSLQETGFGCGANGWSRRGIDRGIVLE